VNCLQNVQESWRGLVRRARDLAMLKGRIRSMPVEQEVPVGQGEEDVLEPVGVMARC